MPFDERKIIIENISFVDEVIGFEDDDLGSCINALKLIKNMFPNDEIIFANGGDRIKKIFLRCKLWNRVLVQR